MIVIEKILGLGVGAIWVEKILGLGIGVKGVERISRSEGWND